MPLPHFLSGSYKQYKEDTNIFTTWLHQAAESCGYKPTAPELKVPGSEPKEASPANPAPSRRLKGKDRKLAKLANGGAPKKPVEPVEQPPKTVKYQVSTQALLAQAEAVAQSNKDITMPAEVQAVLERAIGARQRCTDWFLRTKVWTEHSNEGHQHFIEMLRKVKNLLGKPAAETGENPSLIPGHEKLRNMFQVLEVEDVEHMEEDPVTMTNVTLTTKKSSVPSKSKKSKSAKGKQSTTGKYSPQSTDIYQLEVEPAFENAFALFCFFEDLHVIEDSLLKIWMKFKAGETSLTAATIITHAAFNTVKKMEDEIHVDHPHHISTRDSYTTLALPVFYADALENGEDPNEILNTPKGLEYRPFDDFIYLPTARILMKFAQVAKMLDKIAWPIPVPPLRFSYISRPELLELPGYRKLEEEDRVLSQLLLDIALADTVKKNLGSRMRPGEILPEDEDDFTKTVRELWTTGGTNGVSTHTVFACRVLLDVLDLFDSRPKFYDTMLIDSKTAQSIFGYRIHSDGSLDTAEVRWLSKDNQLLLHTYQLTDKHMGNPAFPSMKQFWLQQNPPDQGEGFSFEDAPPEWKERIRAHLIAKGFDPDDGPTKEHNENARKLDPKMIRPAEELDFSITHNPFHCGTLTLKLAVSMEDAGIALANHHMSIHATANLYNALRQLNLTENGWPEMEWVMKKHVGPLFADSTPKTTLEMVHRMSYRTGLTGSGKRFKTEQPWKFCPSATAVILRQLLEGKKSLETALLQLEYQVTQQESHGTVNQEEGKHSQRRREPRPLQSFTRLESSLSTAFSDMKIDYISLVKTCNRLMKVLRAELRQKLGVEYPVVRDAGDSNDHGCLYVVLSILKENQDAFSAHERSNDGSQFKGGKQLQLACKVYETFVTRRSAQPTKFISW